MLRDLLAIGLACQRARKQSRGKQPLSSNILRTELCYMLLVKIWTEWADFFIYTQSQLLSLRNMYKIFSHSWQKVNMTDFLGPVLLIQPIHICLTALQQINEYKLAEVIV